MHGVLGRNASAYTHKTMRSVLLSAIALSFCVSSLPAADSWPQFRGPGSTGVVDDPKLPDKWSATENVAWKTAVPGEGWSSPIVWGNRVFVTSVVSGQSKEPPKKGLYFGGERAVPTDEHHWMIYCFDFDSGKQMWQRELSASRSAKHRASTSSSSRRDPPSRSPCPSSCREP